MSGKFTATLPRGKASRFGTKAGVSESGAFLLGRLIETSTGVSPSVWVSEKNYICSTRIPEWPLATNESPHSLVHVPSGPSKSWPPVWEAQMKCVTISVLCVVLFAPVVAVGLTYSTGSINNYGGNGDLSLRHAAAADFRFWYALRGNTLVSSWQDGNVWASDFQDQGSPNDLDPGGGSDLPSVYLYAGHGSCESPPTSGSADWIITHNGIGQNDSTRIGTSSVWGNNGSPHQFMFLDASCPMDLASITTEWFAPFAGLHMATGHSGDIGHDTLDSEFRVNEFAAQTVGFFWLIPQLPVGDAWMNTGLIDVQSGTCAVATAAGDTQNDAISRRENEMVTSGWSNPSNSWLAWKWVCA